MNLLALLLGIVALLLFLIEGFRPKVQAPTWALLPFGLAAFVGMFVAQWLMTTSNLIHT